MFLRISSSSNALRVEGNIWPKMARACRREMATAFLEGDLAIRPDTSNT